MKYHGELRLFLEKSRMELLRLERQIESLEEIISRLEVFVESYGDPVRASGSFSQKGTPTGGIDTGEPLVPSTPPLPSPSPPFPGPSPVNERFLKDGNGSGSALRPVGDVALEILKDHRDGMSLDDLYRRMKDRTDLAPSRDLKNAIRVSLIRRRPMILSEKRGWFRYLGTVPE